ncbi:MAG: TetR/AcrR family transcriptional regulator [Gammaproteobacteria bacterium]
MTVTEPNSRPPNAIRRVKAAERDSELREKLLQAGAMLFAERGTDAVSVADLIGAAGVSRATFYGFFANKTELAAAILAPVFDAGIEALSALESRAPRDSANGLVSVYLNLWKQHREALLLSANIDADVFAAIQSRHDAFNAYLLDVLRVIESGGLLRNDSAEETLRVIASTAIPLLRAYSHRDRLASIYRESVLGLILKDESRWRA